jgi:hypothetical protein
MAKLKITSKQYKTLVETARRDHCCVRCSGCAGLGPDAGGVQQVGRPGAVTGEYGGVTAEMALGLGVGAKVLLGGSSKRVTLQTLSVEGDTASTSPRALRRLSGRSRSNSWNRSGNCGQLVTGPGQ